MNSTRPITSAEDGPLAAAILGVIAFAAVAVVGVNLRETMAAVARSDGIGAAHAAAAMPISPTRDQQLDRAQGALTEALRVRPDDAALWAALAETRWHQATGAEVRTLSRPLLAAALDAARRAADLAPNDPAAHALLAQALALTPGSEGEAARALRQSYHLAPLDEALAPVRVGAAQRVWRYLDVASQGSAEAEACMARRSGAALEGPFAAVMENPACSAIAGPGSSPPSP